MQSVQALGCKIWHWVGSELKRCVQAEDSRLATEEAAHLLMKCRYANDALLAMASGPFKTGMIASSGLSSRHAMKCKRCNTLLAAYERSVHVFVNAVLTFREAEGDDSTMSVKEEHRLQLKCKDARDALMAHLRKRHGDFDKNAEAST